MSAYVHREGHWNAWKKEVFERMLPVLQARGALQPSPPPKEWAPPVDRAPQQLGADPFPERTLVIDVGANIGFYSMLFATRGYDVLALEPSKEAVIRLLMSLHGNGIRVARSGTEVGLAGSGSGRKGSGGAPLRGGVEGDASGASAAAAAAAAAALADGPLRSTRQPIVYAMQNAAGDAYAAAYLNYIADNPGASSVVADARADTVAQGECYHRRCRARRAEGGGHSGLHDSAAASRWLRLHASSHLCWLTRCLRCPTACLLLLLSLSLSTTPCPSICPSAFPSAPPSCSLPG